MAQMIIISNFPHPYIQFNQQLTNKLEIQISFRVLLLKFSKIFLYP